MTTTRFDNLPTAELVELERQSRDDRRTLMALIRERFNTESGFQIGKSYRIISGRFKGRRMILRYITLGGDIPMIYTNRPVYPLADGPLNKGANGWNCKHFQTPLEHLDPTPLD